jgi:hypothetical protein
MQDFPSASVRRLHRVSVTIPISLLVKSEDSETRHDAFTVDFSRRGARVRTTFLLSRGEMVGIIPWGDCGEAIRSRVVWVQRSSVFGALAGVEFLDTLSA